MADNENDGGILLCAGCGKIIGKLENGSMTIRHKERSVVISPILADINVEIVCESCKTINKFQKKHETNCLLL